MKPQDAKTRARVIIEMAKAMPDELFECAEYRLGTNKYDISKPKGCVTERIAAAMGKPASAWSDMCNANATLSSASRHNDFGRLGMAWTLAEQALVEFYARGAGNE